MRIWMLLAYLWGIEIDIQGDYVAVGYELLAYLWGIEMKSETTKGQS